MIRNEFIECQNCSFVLVAEASTEPAPKRQDRCPDCGSECFEFVRN